MKISFQKMLIFHLEPGIFVSLQASKALYMTTLMEGFCSYASQRSQEQAYFLTLLRFFLLSLYFPTLQLVLHQKEEWESMILLLQFRWMSEFNINLTFPSINLMSGEGWGTKELLGELVILFITHFYFVVLEIEPRVLRVLCKHFVTFPSPQI